MGIKHRADIKNDKKLITFVLQTTENPRNGTKKKAVQLIKKIEK